MNIALLEDNPSVIEYLVTLLKFSGHLVFPYVDAVSFLGSLLVPSQVNDPSLLRIPIDLAILDLMLPGQLSGLDVMHTLRETEISYAKLPLIVLSGSSQSTLDEVHSRFPTIPILGKPFHMRELLTLVDTIGTTRETERKQGKFILRYNTSRHYS